MFSLVFDDGFKEAGGKNSWAIRFLDFQIHVFLCFGICTDT
jgi:hypothetical protein